VSSIDSLRVARYSRERYSPKQYIHIGITTMCRNTHSDTISITLRLACGSLVPCIQLYIRNGSCRVKILLRSFL